MFFVFYIYLEADAVVQEEHEHTSLVHKTIHEEKEQMEKVVQLEGNEDHMHQEEHVQQE